MSRTLTISPATRLEGHAEIAIDLNDSGAAQDVRFSVQTFRGFEKFLEGMPADDLPQLTCRVCGICFSSHGLCSVKAIEAAWGVEISPEARKVRELLNFGQYIESHALALAVLSLPDFVYPDAGPEKRNIVGLLGEHEDVAKQLLLLRQAGSMITRIVGGRPVHPQNFVVGGVVRTPTAAERQLLLEGLEGHDKTLATLWSLIKDLLLDRPDLLSLGATETHYLGLVDADRLAFYDGEMKLLDPGGQMITGFPCSDYFVHLKEEEKDFSYMKFPVLAKGGKVRVGPLARVNLIKSCGTPQADAVYAEAKEQLGFPTDVTMAYHVARLIETVYAWERAVELLKDDDVSSDKALGGGHKGQAGVGTGIVEAPRGTLVHHYEFNDQGRLENCELIVATQHNNHAINDGLAATARALIDSPDVPETTLNRLEMIVRAYDPCLSCATHAVDQRPFSVVLRDHDGRVVRRW